MNPTGRTPSHTSEEEKFVIKHCADKTVMELAADLGRSHKTIRRWLRNFGLEAKPADQSGARRLELSEEQISHLRENWFEPMNRLGEELKLNELTIKRHLKLLGMERPKGKTENMRLRAHMYRMRNHSEAPEGCHQLPLTRADAKRAGELYFWDGQPCESAGHISKRKTLNGCCWECEKEQQKERLTKNPELQARRNNQSKEYWKRNKQDLSVKHKERMQSEEGRKWLKSYYADKRENDVEWKIAKTLRDRLRETITRQSAEKKESAINLVGCSIPKVRNHLEKQFEAWMTWENYGRGGWHIDHIRPCMSFDLQEEAQQNVCFNWRNLQPLAEAENLSKSDNYEPADEVEWSGLMRELGYDGELFLMFEEGRGGLYGSPTN